jgi:hypothetical protein
VVSSRQVFQLNYFIQVSHATCPVRLTSLHLMSTSILTLLLQVFKDTLFSAESAFFTAGLRKRGPTGLIRSVRALLGPGKNYEKFVYSILFNLYQHYLKL